MRPKAFAGTRGTKDLGRQTCDLPRSPTPTKVSTRLSQKRNKCFTNFQKIRLLRFGFVVVLSTTLENLAVFLSLRGGPLDDERLRNTISTADALGNKRLTEHASPAEY